MIKKKSSQSGVALLMSLGMLALLSVLGASFAVNMRLMERTTRDFIYDVQARYLAEAGIEYAIASMKQDTRNNFEFSRVDTDDGISLSSTDLPSDSAVDVKIIDTARQVNINNANANLLECLPQIGVERAGTIKTYRDNITRFPPQEFITKQSICLVPGISSGTYSSIKDLIATNTYSDPNVQDDKENIVGENNARSAININTVDAGILENMISKVDPGNAAAIATNICDARPIDSWADFTAISGMTDDVREAFNPNREKSPSYYGAFPTEFCFHSGGTYEITATGTITKGAQTVASKQISATVNIFNLWNMTTKEQFKGNPKNPPDYDRITWFNTCPVNSAGEELRIDDSLKLGYWDNFTEDVEYSQSVWRNISGYCYISGGVFNGAQYFPMVGLGMYGDDKKKWRWEYFSVKVDLNDVRDTPPTQALDHYTRMGGQLIYYDVGAHLFVNSSTDSARGTVQYDICLSRLDPKETCPFPKDPDHEPSWPEKYYLRLRGYKEEIRQYYDQKTFEVVRTVAAADNDAVTVNVYHFGGSNSLSRLFPHWYQNYAGMVRVYGAYSGFTFDDIRIIGMCSSGQQLSGAGEYGYYDYSPTPPKMPADYEWGTIFATVTIPTTADADSEKVSLYTRSAGTDSWNFIGESPDEKEGPRGSSVSGSISAANSASMQYRAHLTTTDGDFSETPVLEDIWITYLPKTRILYWRE